MPRTGTYTQNTHNLHTTYTQPTHNLHTTYTQPTHHARISSPAAVERNFDLVNRLLKTTKFPALYNNLNDACVIDKSQVANHRMFGKGNQVGKGLIAARDIEVGEKLYTILETTVDVEIASKQRHHLYDVFDLGGGEVLQPLEADTKPYLYYLQHDDVGNVQVFYNVQPCV